MVADEAPVPHAGENTPIPIDDMGGTAYVELGKKDDAAVQAPWRIPMLGRDGGGVADQVATEGLQAELPEIPGDSATQAEGHKRRRGRLAGSRARRELLDSEGFSLQWNVSHGLGSELLQQDCASTRNATRPYGCHPPGDDGGFTDETVADAAASRKTGSTSSDSSAEAGASEPLPAWARATRRCLRLYATPGSAEGAQTCVSVGAEHQAKPSCSHAVASICVCVGSAQGMVMDDLWVGVLGWVGVIGWVGGLVDGRTGVGGS